MKNTIAKLGLPTFVAAAALLSSPAHAFVIDFGTDVNVGGFNISPTAQAAIGASHQVEVTEAGNGNIHFEFTNNDVTYDSSITDIYFGVDPAFGDTFDFLSFSNPVGTVAFSAGASPADPPPGSSTFASFSADSDSPATLNGIGSGEALTFIFDNISNPSLSFADIEQGFADGTYGIITHVQQGYLVIINQIEAVLGSHPLEMHVQSSVWLPPSIHLSLTYSCRSA